MRILILNVVVSGVARTSQTYLKLEPSYRMRNLAPVSLSGDLSILLIGHRAIWRERVTGMEAETRQAGSKSTGREDTEEYCSVRLFCFPRDLSDFPPLVHLSWISGRYPIAGPAAVWPAESARLRTSGIVSRCSASSFGARERHLRQRRKWKPVLECLNCLSKFTRREGMREMKSINFPDR